VDDGGHVGRLTEALVLALVWVFDVTLFVSRRGQFSTQVDDMGLYAHPMIYVFVSCASGELGVHTYVWGLPIHLIPGAALYDHGITLYVFVVFCLALLEIHRVSHLYPVHGPNGLVTEKSLDAPLQDHSYPVQHFVSAYYVRYGGRSYLIGENLLHRQ